MSRIVRKTATIFGSTAGANQIAEFGSLAASAPVFTTDPAVIQSLSNWAQGWFSAIIGSNSPAIEDMNAFCYVMAYQIAYLLQQGIPEWDSGTTYFTNDLVSSNGITYVSLQDNNTNHAVTVSAFWAEPVKNGLVTPNTMIGSPTVATGNSLFQPYLKFSSGTLTIATGAQLVSVTSLIISGTGVLVLQGTAVARVL